MPVERRDPAVLHFLRRHGRQGRHDNVVRESAGPEAEDLRRGEGRVSAGRGGVRLGPMNGSGSSETTGSAIGLRPKALLVDRSHNPWREADRRAAYGKSVCAVRGGG